ncbi:MAG TPA: cyclic nucleotide-gated ion channel [Pseudolabrys sp.]|jgi:voltage-gated potassium channel|nr:cyclic nucleotide-gated ion channel [Pseudolabrys sp.]
MAMIRLLKSGTLTALELVVLAAGLLAMIVMTMPGLPEPARLATLVVLWLCLAYYVCELAIKLRLRRGADTRYLHSTEGIVDLLAVVPIPIALVSGLPANVAWLLASLWVLKLAMIVPGLGMLGRVLKLEARALASVVVIFLTILILASVALYALEGAAQPQQFGSMPLALWWAVTTLSSTGYGDAVPATFLGRLIAGIVMISGLGVFGLWTGILATGFAAEHRRRDFIRNWDLVTRVPFLKNLDPPTVIELTRMLRRLDLAEKTVVVRRGRPGDCMYFIASGEVEVKIEPPIKLSAGAFFGEMALLTGAPRTANVVTTEATTLLALEVADFHQLTAHHPELARAVAAEAARRGKPGENKIARDTEHKPRDVASR